ncbi:hypothetical protein F511_19966 [Dorcoceras hygrometricum]|uniref:Uncharacterized protein n=1 Tax=Dorcoceras hygrometricum TaxID=472368 RepID=A0A2Z7AES7_9LAMI|nr:hypothetical protein F511_19966 [Dorcoceras hygrometricum]
MSGRGRGRRSNIDDETNPDSNDRIAQLLELMIEQSARGNGQSSSSRGPHYDDSQERFRRQKPQDFSGTTEPLVAESWIKSMGGLVSVQYGPFNPYIPIRSTTIGKSS